MPKTIKNQTEVFLRFYASMTNRPYELVCDEYLGKIPDENGVVNNKLYAAVRTAVAETSQLVKEAEPWDAPASVPYKIPIEAYESAIVEYTANIEKRLG